MNKSGNMAKRFLRRLADFAPSCKEATRWQSEGLERPLSPARRVGLRLHLLICKWCRQYGNQIRFLRRAAREHPEKLTQAAPPNLSPEARERIKRSMAGGK